MCVLCVGFIVSISLLCVCSAGNVFTSMYLLSLTAFPSFALCEWIFHLLTGNSYIEGSRDDKLLHMGIHSYNRQLWKRSVCFYCMSLLWVPTVCIFTLYVLHASPSCVFINYACFNISYACLFLL